MFAIVTVIMEIYIPEFWSAVNISTASSQRLTVFVAQRGVSFNIAKLYIYQNRSTEIPAYRTCCLLWRHDTASLVWGKSRRKGTSSSLSHHHVSYDLYSPSNSRFQMNPSNICLVIFIFGYEELVIHFCLYLQEIRVTDSIIYVEIIITC